MDDHNTSPLRVSRMSSSAFFCLQGVDVAALAKEGRLSVHDWHSAGLTGGTKIFVCAARVRVSADLRPAGRIVALPYLAMRDRFALHRTGPASLPGALRLSSVTRSIPKKTINEAKVTSPLTVRRFAFTPVATSRII